jgi:NAD(P)-dependent dehydrogenase (short-subunit alcohol dehydrogenase family)
MALRHPFEKTTTDDWHHMMDTYVESCFFGALADCHTSRKSQGSIIDIGKTLRGKTEKGYSAYQSLSNLETKIRRYLNMKGEPRSYELA